MIKYFEYRNMFVNKITSLTENILYTLVVVTTPALVATATLGKVTYLYSRGEEVSLCYTVAIAVLSACAATTMTLYTQRSNPNCILSKEFAVVPLTATAGTIVGLIIL